MGAESGKDWGPFFRMKLFVAEGELNSRLARENLERICQKYLAGRYSLEILDVLEDYRPALEENVLVVPTLIVYEPPPPIRLVGPLSDPATLLKALGIPVAESRP
jgi:circadian clock protein KaiB